MIAKDFLQPKYEIRNSDYYAMLDELGFTEEYIKSASFNTHDLIEIELKNIELRESDIEGNGLFVTSNVKSGDLLGEARIFDKRTQLGRYTNHSDSPNVLPFIKDKRMLFVACNDISKNEELTVDYRETKKLAERLDSRLSIIALHEKIETMDNQKYEDDFPTFHHFSEGVYAREFHMKKDDIVVGKIHRHDHIAMLIKGKALVTSERGKIEIEAPHIWNSKAGEKRAVYGIEDCIFVTIHPTDETDLDKIEDEVIAPDFEALEETI